LTSDQRGGLANVLVLEDNAILAIDLEDMLRDLGAKNVRVATTIEAARGHIDTGLTLGLLDFTLGDNVTAEPLAHELEARGIPFLFVTGYCDSQTLPQALRSHPLLAKPFTPDDLQGAIQDVVDTDRRV
jgi:DNA-binding NtrC family response regulator